VAAQGKAEASLTAVELGMPTMKICRREEASVAAQEAAGAAPTPVVVAPMES
jgi:hypothetical protein